MAADGNIPGESNALQVQIPCIVFFIVTPIFVAIRVWSRKQMRAGLKSDDWTIIVSFVSLLWSNFQVKGLISADILYDSFDLDHGFLSLRLWPTH